MCHTRLEEKLQEKILRKDFNVSKERVRSWSHAFLITYDKTLTKKLLAVRPEKVTLRKTTKPLERQLQSFWR